MEFYRRIVATRSVGRRSPKHSGGGYPVLQSRRAFCGFPVAVFCTTTRRRRRGRSINMGAFASEAPLRRSGQFLAAHDDPGAPIVLMGAPMDVTTSFRPGTRFGLGLIRDESDGLDQY